MSSYKVSFSHISLSYFHPKPGDSKREEFRKYLEKAGVLDTLTKVLVGLYEEPSKPDNALEFIKKHLQSDGPDPVEFEAMRVELAEMRQKVEQLEAENAQLKRSSASRNHSPVAATGSSSEEANVAN
ncbi:C-Myc-binding protein [Fasciolopsis buskii]|uniref:c-Myc-binding protein n=1 Tax=Fasciolopsis buskii TaxID=27845 RepID=A0A8E0S1F7_9TREM|nr:C-Myc-binding protein [Fasciolopsis buski]